MARFNFEDADNYGGSGNSSSFFSLKNDKDTARVRFLYRGMQDIEGYACHKVAVGTRQNGAPNERYVNCLRAYNEPVDNCPFCAAGFKVTPRLFIKLFNEDTKEVQVWDRSKSYYQRLAGLAARYNPLCDEVVEIERNGVAGDMHTDYMFYPVDNSQFDIEGVEIQEPLGSIILDKSAEEMEQYLDTGAFPNDGQAVAQTRSANRENLEQPTGRRTPSNTGRRAF